jgi:hyaluronan synthase
MSEIPEARYVQQGAIWALAVVPLAAVMIWAINHALAVATACTGHGNPLALTWMASILLLWWVVVAWIERPATTTARQQRQLDAAIVTVAVPCYNEDPQALRLCLVSLLEQTRLPDRVHVVDDGSTCSADYEPVRTWLSAAAADLGVLATWLRTENRGKRHAQMQVLTDDDADIFVTVDSDSTLDRNAIAEGVKPFADPEVQSVAGMVAVWNYRTNLLTRMTCMLYTPFTRGFRSAQSVLGRVMVNSGTLAFYRGALIRKYAGAYENERFMGRPMQMNDDSMMTFYGLHEGKTVHQPTSVAFTLVPEHLGNYFRQQKRWMRGTFIRTLWWVRYMSLRDAAFWMPLGELASFVLSQIVLVVLVLHGGRYSNGNPWQLAAYTLAVLLGMNYLIAMRYFIIQRSDEPVRQQLLTVALAPLAGLWRMLVLRPMHLYAYLTFWKIGSWGTRQQGVEVTAA